MKSKHKYNFAYRLTGFDENCLCRVDYIRNVFTTLQIGSSNANLVNDSNTEVRSWNV